MTIDTAPLVIGMAWLGALTAWIVATTGVTREALQELKEKLHDHNGLLAEMRIDRENTMPKPELERALGVLSDRIVRLDKLVDATVSVKAAASGYRTQMQWAIGTVLAIVALIVNHWWNQAAR